MAKPEAVVIFVGTYPSKAAAEADYEVVKDLHAVGAVGSYDAAVVTKDGNGPSQLIRSVPNHPGGHMRPAKRAGTRRWALVPATVVVMAVSGLAAGCSSSKPAYCTDASQLKTSVQDLGNVNINVHDLSSVNAAVSKVQADATAFASDAKSAYPSQTTALKNSLSSLETAVKSAMGQPSLTTVSAVVSSIAQVKTAAGNLQTAAKGACQ